MRRAVLRLAHSYHRAYAFAAATVSSATLACPPLNNPATLRPGQIFLCNMVCLNSMSTAISCTAVTGLPTSSPAGLETFSTFTYTATKTTFNITWSATTPGNAALTAKVTGTSVTPSTGTVNIRQFLSPTSYISCNDGSFVPWGYTRVGNVVTCTVHCVDISSNQGYCTAADFAAPTAALGTPTSLSQAGNSALTFTVTESNGNGSESVSVVLTSQGTSTTLTYAFPQRVSYAPDAFSAITCTPTSGIARPNQAIPCALYCYALSTGNAVPCLTDDFGTLAASITGSGSISISDAPQSQGTYISFSLTATSSGTVSVSYPQVSGTDLLSDPLTFDVYDYPDSTSLLVCDDATLAPVQPVTTVTCNITCSFQSSTTPCQTTDFSLDAVTFGSTSESVSVLSTLDSGSLNYHIGFSFEFNDAGSADVYVPLNVPGYTGTTNHVAFTVYPPPDGSSTLTCDNPTPVVVDTTFTCTIVPKYSLSVVPAKNSNFDVTDTNGHLSSVTPATGTVFTFTVTPSDPTIAFFVNVTMMGFDVLMYNGSEVSVGPLTVICATGYFLNQLTNGSLDCTMNEPYCPMAQYMTAHATPSSLVQCSSSPPGCPGGTYQAQAATYSSTVVCDACKAASNMF